MIPNTTSTPRITAIFIQIHSCCIKTLVGLTAYCLNSGTLIARNEFIAGTNPHFLVLSAAVIRFWHLSRAAAWANITTANSTATRFWACTLYTQCCTPELTPVTSSSHFYPTKHLLCRYTKRVSLFWYYFSVTFVVFNAIVITMLKPPKYLIIGYK